jgi:hypothetical protein
LLNSSIGSQYTDLSEHGSFVKEGRVRCCSKRQTGQEGWRNQEGIGFEMEKGPLSGDRVGRLKALKKQSKILEPGSKDFSTRKSIN